MDKSSPAPTIRSLASEAVKRGAIDLSQGVIHAAPPTVLFDLLKETEANRLLHGYGETLGDTTYREAIATLWQIKTPAVTVDNVMGTSGVIGGILSALLSHCQANDRVLMIAPCFSGYPWVVEAARCQPVYVPSRDSGEPDWEVFEREARTAKAVLFANPSNPAGYMWTRDDAQRLLALASKHNLLVIADEIYVDFVYEGEHESLVNEAIDNDDVIVLSGFAKNLAAAGWRAGYAISTPARIINLAAQHDKFCPGGVTIAQHVIGKGWLEHPDTLQQYVKNLVAMCRGSRDVLTEAFRGFGMEPQISRGAIYMLIKHNRRDDLAAMEELLDRNIAVTPARVFFGDQKSSDFIRIHFAVPMETAAKVAERITSSHFARS